MLKGFKKGERPEKERKRKRESSGKQVEKSVIAINGKAKEKQNVCFMSACTENAGGRLVSKGQSKSEPRKLISNLKYCKLSEVNENQVEAT